MKIKFFRHTFYSLVVVLSWVIILFGVGVYGFLTTNMGAQIITFCGIQSYIPFSDVKIGSLVGTIQSGVVLKDVVIKNIPDIKNATIQIQQLDVKIPLIYWKNLSIKINNARLTFAASDPIVFNGEINNERLTGNLFSKSVDVKEIVSNFGYEKELGRYITGFLSRVDLVVDGLVKAPHFKGHFIVDKFIYQETLLKDGFGRIDLSILELGEHPLMQGNIVMESALVNVSKITIDVLPSKAEFKGDVQNPTLDIHGSTKVEDVRIDIAVKGTLVKPVLLFASDPPMSEGAILNALISRGWAGIGLDKSQTIGLRRNIGDALNVGMKIEQEPDRLGRPKETGYAQTIQGQLNLTDKFSFNLSQKYLPTRDGQNTTNPQQTEKKNETEFLLQYKERF